MPKGSSILAGASAFRLGEDCECGSRRRHEGTGRDPSYGRNATIRSQFVLAVVLEVVGLPLGALDEPLDRPEDAAEDQEDRVEEDRVVNRPPTNQTTPPRNSSIPPATWPGPVAQKFGGVGGIPRGRRPTRSRITSLSSSSEGGGALARVDRGMAFTGSKATCSSTSGCIGIASRTRSTVTMPPQPGHFTRLPSSSSRA